MAAFDITCPCASTVGIRFNTDGTIETGFTVDSGPISWTAAGDWITPTTSANNRYDVRFTNFNGAGGGDWSTEAAADDVWISLVDSQRLWDMFTSSEETITFVTDFEVRDGDGAPPATDTVEYTFTITNGL